MDEPLWTVPEAATFLHVSRGTVYGLAHDGEVDLVHVGGRSARIVPASVRAYVARRVAAETPARGVPVVLPREGA